MSSRFQYILAGAGITLLAIAAVLVAGYKSAQASDTAAIITSKNPAETIQPVTVNSLVDNQGQTDEVTALLADRNQLASNWQSSVEEQSGWLHMKILYDREFEGGGTLPDGTRIPRDYISEIWYKSSNAETTAQMVNLMWDLEGNLVQVATYRDGYWRNFSDNSKVADTPPALPQDDRFIAGNVAYNKIIREDKSSDDLPTVPFTYHYSHPALSYDEIGLEGVTINGGIIRETIDTTTGQVLYVTTTFQMADGSERFSDEYSYLLTEIVDDVPADVAEYLESAATLWTR
jgi:hypothetical protein